jgi:hypothetical protein
MQTNTDRVVMTLAPNHRLILCLQQTERRGIPLRSRRPHGCAGPDLSTRHQCQLATLGSLIAFTSYVWMLTDPIGDLSHYYNDVLVALPPC